MPTAPALLAQVSPEAVGVGIGIGFFLLIALTFLSGVALFAFWIWMLVDCAQSPEPPGDNNHHLVWILVLVFAGWIGALVYYFVVRQPRLAAGRRPPPPEPHSPPVQPYPTPPPPPSAPPPFPPPSGV